MAAVGVTSTPGARPHFDNRAHEMLKFIINAWVFIGMVAQYARSWTDARVQVTCTRCPAPFNVCSSDFIASAALKKRRRGLACLVATLPRAAKLIAALNQTGALTKGELPVVERMWTLRTACSDSIRAVAECLQVPCCFRCPTDARRMPWLADVRSDLRVRETRLPFVLPTRQRVALNCRSARLLYWRAR